MERLNIQGMNPVILSILFPFDLFNGASDNNLSLIRSLPTPHPDAATHDSYPRWFPWLHLCLSYQLEGTKHQ